MTKDQQKDIRRLLREYIVKRDGEKCLKCYGRKRLSMSHIYPKGKYRKMEFDHENLKLLCYKCHIHWWHKNPIEAGEWIKQVLPKTRYERLKLRANTNDKTTLDYNILKLELEQLCLNL